MPSSIENLIDIDDLFVCVQNHQFVLMNKNTSKIFMANSSDAVNHRFYPELYKILEKISYKVSIVDLLFELKRIKEMRFPHLDVYFGDSILFKKNFKLFYDKEFFDNQVTFFENLKNILQEKKLILDNFTYFLLENSDNGFLLDLSNRFHQNILLSEIRKNGSVLFYYPEFMEYSKLKSDVFKSEYIYSCFDISKYEFNPPRVFEDTFPEKLINNNLIYIKIYTCRKFELHVLKTLYFKLMNLLENKKILGFHFVRYQENFNNHIRLRVFVNNLFEFSTTKSIINLINYIENIKLVDNIEICKFKREINRYGKSYYYSYELYAIKESMLVLNLMFYQQIDNVHIIYKLGLEILDCFSVSEQFYKEYKTFVAPKHFKLKSQFHKEKGRISDIIDNINLNSNTYYVEWLDSLHKLVSLLKNDYNKYDLFRSVIHLLCNRVVGINRLKEDEVMICLNILNLYRKHK